MPRCERSSPERVGSWGVERLLVHNMNCELVSISYYVEHSPSPSGIPLVRANACICVALAKPMAVFCRHGQKMNTINTPINQNLKFKQNKKCDDRSCRPIRKYLYVGGIVTDFGHNTSCCVIRLLLCTWFYREGRHNRLFWQ